MQIVNDNGCSWIKDLNPRLNIEVLEKNIKGKLNKLILNNCGHNPLIDKPKESINKIKDFINQIEYD